MTRGSLSSEFLDEVRSKNDIVDIASKYLTLTRRGGNFWACCPFHNEKTPSFSIKQEGQFYKCFGCGESGNVITLVMKMENLDFYSAVEILAKSAGLNMPTETDNLEMAKRKRERDIAYRVLRATTDFYHQNLLNNPNSLQSQYLMKRGISPEMIEKFQIGASLNFDDLPKHLSKLGFKYEDMSLAGVIGKGEYGLYDFYGKRLIFPIFNGFGDVVAYSGRSVEDNPNHTKYKNTFQTAVFNKSDILFGLNFVRDLKKQNMGLDTIVIVEGHIDVISCHQVGITNTIGCMGTALTTQHARKIKQLVDNVILCLDGDSAGANATYKAIDVLKDIGLNVRVVRLSGAKDPDEFIKKYGKDVFLDKLNSAINCVDFILTDLSNKYDFNSNADKTKYVNEAISYISKFSTPAEQEIYLSFVQQLVKVPLDALRKSLNAIDSTKSNKAKDNLGANMHIQKENMVQETLNDNYIIESKIMLLSSILYKKINNLEDVEILFKGEDELSELYNYLKEKIKENKEYNISSLFDSFDINSNSLIDRVINYDFPDESVYPEFLKDTIRRVKLYEIQEQREKLKRAMLESNSDEERMGYLVKIKELTDRFNKEKK